MATPRALHTYSKNKISTIQKTLKEKEFNPLIYAKYGVKKYEIEDDQKEPVDAYLYDKHSKHIPILEEQALKRGESLFEAMKKMLTDSDRKADIYAIEKIQKAYRKEVEKLYTTPFEAQPFQTQYETVKSLVKNLLNDFAYHWGHAHPNASALLADDYNTFYRDLFHTVELVQHRYKKVIFSQ